jgi:outer membrane protein assembly factor BamB
LFCSLALAVVTVLGVGGSTRAQDWPQWRGPLGHGITSAKNLPPKAGSTSLKVLWKTPIPGEGCSSPIVSDGRVYLTTAYEGSERHAWDQPAFWATIVLTCCVAALALTQIPSVWRSCTPRSTWMAALGGWTIAVVGMIAVVLAKPRWFWQFADPWTGTTVVPAELPWVESLHLRPLIVLACGSLMLIFIALQWGERQATKGEDKNCGSLAPLLTLAVTLAASIALALIGWRPDWFFQASQPWLAWLVTGGLGFFATAGSIGWLPERGKTRLLLAGAGFTLAGWLFYNLPSDEFGLPLSRQNRIAFLVPGLMLIGIHACAIKSEARGPTAKGKAEATRGFLPISHSPFLPFFVAGLALIVFIRANYLQPQTGVVRAVVCLDAESGAVLWTTPIYVATAEKKHSLNSLATPTPACDGERVYAYFGSGLAALDTNGRLLWLKRDAEFAGFIRYGAGSSVVLADDKIILYRDSEFMGHGDHLDDDIQSQTNRRPSALTAYDKATGAEVWTIAPPFSHDSYMTPLIWTRGGQRELVVATWKTLAGFAVSDGSLNWTHPYPMQQIVPSPAVNGDCLIVTGGNVLPGPIMAVRASTPTAPAQTIWFNGKTGGNIVSPVCWDGLVFSVAHIGVLTCRDAQSGQIHWKQRLGSRCLASLVAGDGKVYALDQEGKLHVFAADATGSVLATHSFDELCSATPAIATSLLFVRTSGHLYCIGSGK